MALRILFLADAVFDDLPGGSRVVARELAWQFVDAGHHVTMLVGRQNESAPADETTNRGVRIVRYNGAGNPFEFIRNGQIACRRLLAEHHYDIVHTHFAYAAVGPLRAIPQSIPRIRTFHGPWDEEMTAGHDPTKQPALQRVQTSAKVGLARNIEASNLKSSSNVIALSDVFAQMLASKYRVPRTRIHVIPGGVNINRFELADRNEQRMRLGLPLDRRILLSVRRLAPRMGLDNLIRALPEIIVRQPDVLLVIGGNGPEKGKLIDLINELRLQQNVKMAGFIPDGDLAGYYQAADLFVLPTLALEGFGLVTMEALACGTPVIGTPVGAIPETLQSLSPRLIADGLDHNSLARAISSYFADDWARALTPEVLRNYVLQRYTWDRHASAVEAIYRQALGLGDQ